jgi:GrpB-like predicted nucleotidyltransferase (UPF0157 family)
VIEIVAYDPRWPLAFEAERARILAALGPLARRIDHHGSTAVPGLCAKPIIDIQVSVDSLQPFDAYRQPLATLGYIHVAHADDDRCPFFHRPAEWPHTHHVHVVVFGGDEEQRTLAFRDYLRAHPDAVREYDALKRALAQRFNAAAFESQQAYAEAKTEFVTRVTDAALRRSFGSACASRR